MIRACFLIAILLLSVPSFSLTDTNSESQRFFIEGDGVVILENAHSKVRKTIRYKDKNTSQQEKYIRQVFGLNSKQKIDKIHLRLIALLDALQDRFQENHLIIISGYRSPSYNERLRKQGRTAAKASTHMEGMAADVIFPKNNPEKVWRHIKGLDCCGAGYYYGQSVHIDIGPSRYWTQKTAKVNKNISGNNKRIFITADQDIYHLGETMNVDFGFVTEYPFGTSTQWELYPAHRLQKPLKSKASKDKCALKDQRAQTKNMVWKIPSRLPASPQGLYRVRLHFCQKPHPDMPDFIDSKPIKIVGR